MIDWLSVVCWGCVVVLLLLLLLGWTILRVGGRKMPVPKRRDRDNGGGGGWHPPSDWGGEDTHAGPLSKQWLADEKAGKPKQANPFKTKGG